MPASQNPGQSESVGVASAIEGRAVLRSAFGLAIFAGAFLLFFVQLLLGKQILPIFGGAPAVWTSCLMVFQLLLLAGYSLAHLLASRLPMRRQGIALLLMLGASLALLGVEARFWPSPIIPGASWHTATGASPPFLIIRFLVVAIGFPFLILSTTSSLLQHWFSRMFPQRSPYRLYALSNAGSLLGLLSYPFAIEPIFRLRAQAWLWTTGYCVYAGVYGMCAWKLRSYSAADGGAAVKRRPGSTSGAEKAALGWRHHMLWILLPACASVLLLATTNHICQEVAVVPFLWVVPLSIYLVTFILAFENERWYRRQLFHALFALGAGWVVLVTTRAASYTYVTQLVACCFLLFAGCMICHGETARLRPATERLTSFYLCISTGGALGGVFVSLLAPRIFPGYWEFPLGIVACMIILLWTGEKEAGSWLHRESKWLAAAIAAGVSLVVAPVAGKVWEAANHVPQWMQFSAALAFALLSMLLFSREKGKANPEGKGQFLRAAVATAFFVLLIGLVLPQLLVFEPQVLARLRSFYGTVTVIDVEPDGYLVLQHGTTAHGFQFKRPDWQQIPTGYYGQNSGVNLLLRTWPWHPKRVGLVGMGAGTLAALGESGDTFRFYEINPDIVRFAAGPHAFFTFIKNSKAKIEIVMGDARMSLAQEAAHGEQHRFDILVLDAFSSDAIPVHLLTQEAFELYLTQLRGPDSVIAVHISNMTLDLSPVLAAIAQQFGLHAVRTNPTWLGGFSSRSNWVLLSRSGTLLDEPEFQKVSVPFPGVRRPILWTDDYSNLLRVLR